ncbi:DUF4785 domain-containing protein [Flocculibacter collagenilyticus]|uniref:DUF4785 domain-containing protein n=1 Tax=Flocculibacter collagenilyticus TaxID=2744479 RepID=UPI0018F59169|nr:DUF4785 domain-containing protein [Flocculibacter collagenilyticus]
MKFNNKKVTALTAALSTALFAQTAIANTDNAAAYKVQVLPTHAVSAGIEHSQQRVSYTWPEVQQAMSVAAKQQNLESKEYWQEVSGKQLNQGVKLYNSSADAFVRLAPKATGKQTTSSNAAPLQAEQLYIIDKTTNQRAKVAQLASQKDMEFAGFNDGSVAIKLDSQPVNNTKLSKANTHKASALYLKSEQRLAANDRYLVHVVEKNSQVKLAVTAPRVFQANVKSSFELDAKINAKSLSDSNTTVRLINPDGIAKAAAFEQGNIVFQQPLMHVGAHKGFYDIELTTTEMVNGKAVKRTIKVPFSNVVKTAELDVGSTLRINAHGERTVAIPVNALEAGRYAITATLEATNKSGELEKIETVEVAQWLNGKASVEIPFNMSKLQGFRAPIHITQVKLVDQSRMIVLQQVEQLDKWQAPNMGHGQFNQLK